MLKPVLIDSAKNLAHYCYPFMSEFSREHFFVLVLNVKNELIRVCEVSIGTIDTSIVHPREVFKAAILINGAAIALVHNHPSGNPDPSSSDKSVTKSLIRAGKILGVPVVDHVILGLNGKWESAMSGCKGEIKDS